MRRVTTRVLADLLHELHRENVAAANASLAKMNALLGLAKKKGSK